MADPVNTDEMLELASLIADARAEWQPEFGGNRDEWTAKAVMRHRNAEIDRLRNGIRRYHYKIHDGSINNPVCPLCGVWPCDTRKLVDGNG